MPSKTAKKVAGRSTTAPSVSSPSSPDGVEPRRVPTQERSRQRVARILEAAAEVFANEGMESATMEAIAEKAETSIGSIYQFFPNKGAVFDALAERYHARIRSLLDALLNAEMLQNQTIGDVVDGAIDALSVLHESDAGFRAVWVGLNLTTTIVREGEALNREIARRIVSVVAHKLPGLEPSRRLVVATMVVEIVSAMLIYAARSPADAMTMMMETKMVLRRYLAPYENAKTSKRTR